MLIQFTVQFLSVTLPVMEVKPRLICKKLFPVLYDVLQCSTMLYSNGHLRGPVILAPIDEHLPVKLSLPVFTT